MDLKSNVNKIHSDLISKYQMVNVSEKSSIKIGNFIEFSIVEGKKELKLTIAKYELEKLNFNWSYLSNPEDEKSIVERNSNINNFIIDIQDIFDKNRFDVDYLEKLN